MLYIFIILYADNSLVYVSKVITQKTDAFTFTADLKGAEYLRIEVNPDWNSALILSDFQLSPISDKTVIEEKKFDSLRTLHVLNEDRWEWESDAATDAFGSDYSKVCNYAVIGNTSMKYVHTIEYRIGKNYSKISGKIAPTSSMSEDGNAYVCRNIR